MTITKRRKRPGVLWCPVCGQTVQGGDARPLEVLLTKDATGMAVVVPCHYCGALLSVAMLAQCIAEMD